MERPSLKARLVLVGLAAVAGAAAVTAQEEQQEQPQRQMGLRHTPDSVFTQPVEQVLPELAGATATGENGRVGGELVFWGYKLRDGRDVFMFACVMSETVDCNARAQAICV